jgi:trk system potassium uptake protein TrkA
VKIVIVGCGRVGASCAELWDQAGHEVVILDVLTRAFERLPSTFGGTAERGDGTDEDVLRRAGAEGADVFVAMTEGDNRNVMAAQLAIEAFEIPKVIAKINDPVRSAAYAELGIATICRTGLMVDAMNAYLGFPPSGLSGMLDPTGTHPGGEHHGSRTDGAGPDESTGPSTPMTPAPSAPMEA